MRLLKWILYVSFLVASCSLAVAQNYTFKNFSHEEGMNLISILSVEESNDGYIWFGTDGAGLLRYDGADFNSLVEIQGRNNRHVNNITFHKDDILFSTRFRSIFSLNSQGLSAVPFETKLRGSKAINIHNGRYIVLQTSGVKMFKDSVLIHSKKGVKKEGDFRYYESSDLGDELLIFTSNSNFCIRNDSIMRLHEWLGVDELSVNNFVAAYQKNDSLYILDKYFYKTLSVPIDNVGSENIVVKTNNESVLKANEEVVKWDLKDSSIAFVTNQGRIMIYDIMTSKLKLITRESDVKITEPTDILIDRNNDIWVTSAVSGVYRVSQEPFTFSNRSEIYKEPHIVYVGKTNEGKKLISTKGKGTFIEKESKEDEYLNLKELVVSGLTVLDGVNIISTNKGVYKLMKGELELYEPLALFEGKSVSFIKNAYESLWFSVSGKGLSRMNLESNEVESVGGNGIFYNDAILNQDSSILYFITNKGIKQFDPITNKLEYFYSPENGDPVKGYVGNTAMDKFGTIWFSMDHGLFGIKSEDEIVKITAEKYLPSLLIYTLNADEFGDLIVGSNKGVTVIKISAEGNPLSSKTYNKENGFYGYETHMRASYHDEDGSVYLGTLGGLVTVRPEFFEKKRRLNKPIIASFKNKNIERFIDEDSVILIDSEDNSVLIEFKSVNTKSSFVTYKYRLLGGEEELSVWSEWSPEKEAVYNNLMAGNYVFEVKSSIEGESISETRTLPFNIDIPFYKNRWFIILITGLVVLLSILFLDRSSNFSKKNIILSRDVVADRSVAKSILAFGAFANTLGHIIVSRIDESIESHDLSAIIIGVIVLGLYLTLRFVDQKLNHARLYLTFGFLLLLGYNLAYVYISDIHPFYFLALILVTYIAPYTLEKLRSSVFVGLALGILSVAIIFFVDEAVFNRYVFLIGMAMIIFLMIYNSYLRNNSLEQLIFTSGVVNKGNALVIAFDKKGIISYSSENIEVLLGMKKSLKGQNILFLKEYQPTYNDMKSFSEVDLENNFSEGAIFVTPLITEGGEVAYYQWSCKQFSDELRVILGQDVTEKINLENYYELIVRNADDLIFQTDREGRFTFVNQKCCEVLDQSKVGLINSSFFKYVKPAFKNQLEDFFNEYLKENKKGGYQEFPVITATNELKWLGLNLTPMKKPGAKNVVTGFLGLARDITSTREANAIIKEQNKDITSSINYAKKIQFNMLPFHSDFERLFDEHCIFFQPKDIVSGDFFWLKDVGDKTVLVLSDCTGHGVPGSFMTLLGINILNQIVLESKIFDPGEILNQLDVRLAEVLPRDGANRLQDGMEAVVCVFDQHSNKVEYALAGGRFIITEKGSSNLEVIKGQIKHIGDVPFEKDFSYKTESLKLLSNQTLYLFSDGYPDQFGGDRNKKLTIKRFLSIMEETAQLNLDQQKKHLQKVFKDWIRDYPQTDDVTIIGVKGVKANKE
ncbi:SpoIIE family protein phosphatase [Brumimicrobium aurantiacum]|uniref:PAS domain S-box protein n=1 Tax=Brumimicrobium aurantiacum TaxID=1737063 RepID=A0A3E1EY35_9FLAO|nr:SpoIIE family protein phosphatase [Brumimicrobium aurantiacum]RFC54475.1 PAS domain S-box protein [Brumimicrobium aurantiacum]